MINSITGKLSGLKIGEAYISTEEGLEFRVAVSAQTANSIMSHLGKSDDVKLYTHLIHREDEMKLIGFSTTEEREIYEELTKISGIGAKLTLKILSYFTPRAFIDALDKGDVKALARVPGMGLKTAQKILIMMREKLVDINKDVKEDKTNTLFGNYTDIINAAVDMGYEREKIKNVITKVIEEDEKFNTLDDDKKEAYLFRILIQGSSDV